jgi:hypothetical protein
MKEGGEQPYLSLGDNDLADPATMAARQRASQRDPAACVGFGTEALGGLIRE